MDDRSMNAPVVRWQVLSADPDASSRFFTQLFGWKIERNNPLGYREVTAGDGGINGGIWPAPEGVKPFVQLFIRVPDIDACLASATALGATVIVPKTVLPGGDAMAVLLDPQGLPIAVCRA